MKRLRIGMGDSYGLRIPVLRAEGFDPSTVTAVVFMITKPTSPTPTHVEWPGTLDDQSADAVTADVRFEPDGSSLDVVGEWRVWLQFATPGETPGPRTEVTTFNVVAADAK